MTQNRNAAPLVVPPEQLALWRQYIAEYDAATEDADGRRDAAMRLLGAVEHSISDHDRRSSR